MHIYLYLYLQKITSFFADRTNGCAYDTVLRPSGVCRLSVVCDVMYCG